MKIVRAEVLGFCMGVRRAVELAIAESEQAKIINNDTSKKNVVYTLGPLIHNTKVLNDLGAIGVKSVNSPDELPESADCSVIIRAHGINPKIENDLLNKKYRIVDATCPKVKINQLKTQELSDNGFHLFFAGEAEHAEIKGLAGYSCSAVFCKIIGSIKEANEAANELYKKNKNAKTALLGQTTISEEEYKCISDEIKKFFPDIFIVQTICDATRHRQQALRDLLTCVDAVIVAGSSESANTRRLFAIARESGKPCILAESKEDIPAYFYSFAAVGLCAGASTPDSVIDEIENHFKKIIPVLS